ncbi:MAG: fasciclin domain-containing protein [Thermomonas sp.]
MKTMLTIAIATALAMSACSAAEQPATPAAMPDAAASVDAAMPDDSMAATPENPMVGGAAMNASDTIVANASAAPNLTTLVAAVKAAGLVDTLQGAGPFTVFAPTNDAFAKLPAGTVESLLKPEMKDALAGVLTYHVVAGNVDAAALMEQIKAGGGKATLATVQGATLIATTSGMGDVILTDAKGGMAKVTTADVRQSNGVVHVIDSVLMP